MKVRFLLLATLNLLACSQKETPNTLFQLETQSGIDFTNHIENSKDFNIFSYRNFYNGAGVAIGDINNDGLADIFFASNMGSNKLYLNKGNWKFEDISKQAGFTDNGDWNTGVVLVDINQDGWLDIYVCNAGYWKSQGGANRLYINNHDNSFTESAKAYGLDEVGYTTHAAFFDYDLDGDLDCYILNNSFMPVNTLNYSNKRDLRAKDWPVADFMKGGGDKLLRNDNGKFVDVSDKAGIYGSLIGFGLGVTVGDVNGDLYPDIYVSNDFYEKDYLYINQKDGTFKECLENCMGHISMSSMGADMADVNNDGHQDIFTTDMLPDDEYRLKTTTSYESIDVYRLKERSGFYHQYTQNTLQANNGNGGFTETAYYSGVAASDWSWGGLLFDADNDGLPDIYVCNGIYHDVTDQDFIDFFANDIIQRMVMTGEKERVNEIINKMPSRPVVNKAFRNTGGLKFTDEGMKWGFTQPSFSNGAAYGDLDNDGDLDLVVNNVNQPAFLYRNYSSERLHNKYISVKLKGLAPNTFAIGSTVQIFAGDQILSREIIPSRGFQSSVDYKAVIGLGNLTPDSMRIIWPNRSYQKIDRPAVNKEYDIVQSPDDKPFLIPQADLHSTLLVPASSPFVKHQEDDFMDFNTDRNIPMMLSREGPRAAIGDVNGDGREDVFIGGASGQAGQLYLQEGNGFRLAAESCFEDDAAAEDVATVFFDADGDGDLDLFIGSGGNNHPPNHPLLQNRLYLNDGKGRFTRSVNTLPPNNMNISVAVAGDFDGNGSLDLFVGGRSAPYNYGVTPNSYLLMNDGKGHFTDKAPEINKDLQHLGLITGAVWGNFTGNGKKDLVITGEWMAPRLFTWQNGHFVEKPDGLDSLLGLWQTVAAADLDGDGDEDLVLGNIGENFYLRPEKDKPVKMWINDFDGNGSVEKILTRTVNGKDMTVFLKRDLTDQIASLKKQNLRYSEFANKSIQELFSPEVISRCEVKTFNYGSSIVAINDGKGHFTVRRLPDAVQLSSVNAVRCTDLNQDKQVDLVLGGNELDLLPQFSRLDGNPGMLLLNDGKAGFSRLDAARSGININGEVRDIKEIDTRKGRLLLFLRNNDYPLLYRMESKAAGPASGKK